MAICVVSVNRGSGMAGGHLLGEFEAARVYCITDGLGQEFADRGRIW
jgi:hypothetical protein